MSKYHPKIVYTYGLYFRGRPKGSSAGTAFVPQGFDITAEDDDKARAAAHKILVYWVPELGTIELRAPEYRRREWIPLIGATFTGTYDNRRTE